MPEAADRQVVVVGEGQLIVRYGLVGVSKHGDRLPTVDAGLHKWATPSGLPHARHGLQALLEPAGRPPSSGAGARLPWSESRPGPHCPPWALNRSLVVAPS